MNRRESCSRYAHYKENLYRERMRLTHEHRDRLYRNMPPWEVPSILNSILAIQSTSRRDARKMVREDKRLAKLNNMKLKDFPRTEWAEYCDYWIGT